jgi:hypothetical protein
MEKLISRVVLEQLLQRKLKEFLYNIWREKKKPMVLRIKKSVISSL